MPPKVIPPVAPVEPPPVIVEILPEELPLVELIPPPIQQVLAVILPCAVARSEAIKAKIIELGFAILECDTVGRTAFDSFLLPLYLLLLDVHHLTCITKMFL